MDKAKGMGGLDEQPKKKVNFGETETMIINVESSLDCDQKENNSIDANLNMSMSE